MTGNDDEWVPVDGELDELPPSGDTPPWYVDGIRFECSACGKCCRNHGDGYAYVYADKAERTAMAESFGMTRKAFDDKYTERVPGGRSLVSKGDACVFLNDKNQCGIYEHRPRQCKTWPFWPELLEDRDTWDEDVASFCPGVGEGPLHDFATIRRTAREAGS